MILNLDGDGAENPENDIDNINETEAANEIIEPEGSSDDEKATEEEQKVIHKTIKKIKADIERFSFNTGVSAFMICVNELSDLKCKKHEQHRGDLL